MFAFGSKGGMLSEVRRAFRSSAPADKFEDGFRAGMMVELVADDEWSDEVGRANGRGSEIEVAGRVEVEVEVEGGGVGERVKSSSIDC